MGHLFRARFAALTVLALAAVLLAGCGSSGNTATVERDADGLPVARVAARYATALANDLDTLVENSRWDRLGVLPRPIARDEMRGLMQGLM
ncbi:MAG: hypothetical protein IH863_05200 [Chloroflexi bacterium]|nr:hypothetical protein [Chloroflexota bacterium]